jgi:anaphase-promoting complex subunit 8
MGHEYVELKNPGAAVEAYRAAVSLNPRDYRAWYGLGQTYELLGLQTYALHYYKRAAALRPDDARMWCAIGMCYECAELRRPDLAMSSYRRALQSNDSEGLALARLAKLHVAARQMDEAAHYYRLNLHRLEEQGAMGEELLDALCFLAMHATSSGRLEEAEQHCARLMDFGGPSKEHAKRILREIRAASGERRMATQPADGAPHGNGNGSPMQTSNSPW